ncbi:MAG: 2-C-methyl-D-erythritol 2,4-cyclodiphosphate synthase [Alphaproteobacteria bacterium GM7ARS4]|nr:2-C-methyl-D-erythritol 2,4-cyclodiphosphate synthase [Alphaproteobacteria bacterium GM7ARS4]
MHTTALIVAGGSGTRFHASQHEKTSHKTPIPKQYQNLYGRPLLAHSLETLIAHPHIDTVQVVIRRDDVTAYTHAVQWTDRHPSIKKKLRPPVYGGATRQQSVYHGLKALATAQTPVDYVLIHDAARPFLSPRLIGRITHALHTKRKQAVLPVLDIVDTIKQVEGDDVLTTLSRDCVKRAQTPQGFRFDIIYQAHMKEQCHPCPASDDSILAERQGIPVSIVQGETQNSKITSQHDMPSQPATTQKSSSYGAVSVPDIRVGSGFDVHALAKGEKMILGGIDIPSPRGLAGHSDADVVLHALTDALFGALAEEDIGFHFPPSESQWRQADSALFLRHAVQRTQARGYIITHCDITVICEWPKITPIRTAMRENMASLLHIPVERVSVKATTSEKLGFCGREEGIAAQATVTLVCAPQHRLQG